MRDFLAGRLIDTIEAAPEGAIVHRVGDSREGWAKAVEVLEAMAFRRERDRTLLVDFSAIRPAGSPIRGMQGRPASGPISLLRAFLNIRRHVIDPARARDRDGPALQPWEQALLVDHYLSVEVQVGGARRAARMATKSWRDPGVLRFIRSKAEGGLWTANNSVMVDREFWTACRRRRPHRSPDPPRPCRVRGSHPLRLRQWRARLDQRRSAGRPSHRLGPGQAGAGGRTGFSQRPLPGGCGGRAAGGAVASCQVGAFPVTTNPCGEIALHVTGGYCVIADFAPLLACPAALDSFAPGAAPAAVAAAWDARVADSVRLGVRFLIRANRMNALYAEEVARTNRIGIGPTGLHEWAWMRFGLAFHDLLDAAPCGAFLGHAAAPVGGSEGRGERLRGRAGHGEARPPSPR